MDLSVKKRTLYLDVARVAAIALMSRSRLARKYLFLIK